CPAADGAQLASPWRQFCDFLEIRCEGDVHGRPPRGPASSPLRTAFTNRLDFGECCTGLNVDAAEKYFQIQTDSKGYTIFIVIVIAMKMSVIIEHIFVI
ncbi:MAG: hypothetical protein WCE24_20935, partial [Pseudolabrys sp.]